MPNGGSSDSSPRAHTSQSQLAAMTPSGSLTPSDAKSYLEVTVNENILVLRGRGDDVDPALLSGQVILHLVESISLKEVHLNFRGKAKLPIHVPGQEPLIQSSAFSQYIVCSHDWSFLEGKKTHNHTMKAGLHVFPFQLNLGGSIPSSIASKAMGEATIQYRLRATATRPGFAHKLQAAIPVFLRRTLRPDALEYQQTLQIENSWPGKLMYSIMIPHKAWAIGDSITTLIKLSPIAKGAQVLNVTTTLTETTRFNGRAGGQEDVRIVSSSKHDIIGHDAVCVSEQQHLVGALLPGSSLPSATSSSVPSGENRSTSSGYLSSMVATNFSQPIRPRSSSLAEIESPHGDRQLLPSGIDAESSDVVSTVAVAATHIAHPSHSLEPILISHRLRWSFLIKNYEGHTSELRCSLPILLLDNTFLDEAKRETNLSRQLLFCQSDNPVEPNRDAELPSYREHVQDRVANIFLSDIGMSRIPSPLRTRPSVHFTEEDPTSETSGFATPYESAAAPTQLPQAPTRATATHLDWVNSELLLSLSGRAMPSLNIDDSPDMSSLARTSASAPGSRRPSRPPSPHSLLQRTSSYSPGSAIETIVHDASQASRNTPGIFQATMRPITFTKTHSWLSSLSSSTHFTIPPRPTSESTQSSLLMVPLAPSEGVADNSVSLGSSDSRPALLHWAFTEVPDYDIASRGFVSGVPPLSSSEGLPSYDQAEQFAVTYPRNDTSLADS